MLSLHMYQAGILLEYFEFRFELYEFFRIFQALVYPNLSL